MRNLISSTKLRIELFVWIESSTGVKGCQRSGKGVSDLVCLIESDQKSTTDKRRFVRGAKHSISGVQAKKTEPDP